MSSWNIRLTYQSKNDRIHANVKKKWIRYPDNPARKINRNATRLSMFLKANKITLEMNIWRFCMHYSRINKLSCHCYFIKLLTRGRIYSLPEITKIASRYGFASGVSRPQDCLAMRP